MADPDLGLSKSGIYREQVTLGKQIPATKFRIHTLPTRKKKVGTIIDVSTSER